MSAGFNTRIVTNGLVIYLDAANRKSHPKTGDTWYDISGGGSNAFLGNSPSYSNNNLGSVQFDSGLEQYGQIDYTTQHYDFTACVWFKRDTSVSRIDQERILDRNPSSGFWMGRNLTNASSWGGGVLESISPYGRFVTLTDGQWHYLVSRRSGATHTISGNGGEVTTSGTVSTYPIENELIIASNQRANGNFFHGNIAVVQLYDRALTDAEIKQNFNAHRGRFGK